jgi:hypothetical protein
MTQSVTNIIFRRVFRLLALAIALPWGAHATVTYTNTYGFFTGSNNLPIIDAVTWVNDAVYDHIQTTYPYDVTSVRNFTNRVSMTGQVGFRFDTVDEVKGRRIPMSMFHNEGEIAGLDSPVQFFNPFFGLGGFLGFGSTVTPASYLLVNATNIISHGTLAVGNVGLMRLTGKDIDLSHGILVAGDVANLNTNVLVSSGNFFNVLDSTTGRGLFGFNSYVNPPQVYDLFWGSHVGKFDSATLAVPGPNPEPSSPVEFVQTRGGQFANISIPLLANSTAADFDVREFAYNFGTNYYFNIVFFRTNVVDPSISVDVRFGFNSPPIIIGTNFIQNGSEAILEFGTKTNDIVTGLPVTNAFYLLDSGAFTGAITVYTNAADQNKLGRPSAFEITTATPFEWILSDTNAFPFLSFFYKDYDEQDIFSGAGTTQGDYKDRIVDYTSGTYGVQVGRQPEVLNGITLNSNQFFGSFFTNLLTLPDPTNDAPRIEINATNLDLTSTYIRSEGLLSIKTKHLVPGTPAGIDVGMLNGEFASTNGLLMMNRIVSPSYKRVRGDVFAWSGNFNNISSNSISTNAVHVHVLIVDHALTANFTPTFRDLALTGTNTVVNDNFRVINSALIKAQQVTINSQLTFAQNAGDLWRRNLPALTDFFIETNGVLNVQGVASIGWDTPHGINSFINHGIFSATSPLVRANYVENTGAIFATNGSSMALIGNTMNLITGTLAPGVPTNTLIASRNIELTANELTVYGSTIVCGQTGANGKLTINTSDVFTDQTPNLPSTSNLLTNFWSTTDGMTVTGLPRGGGFENDLFGTQITLSATNRTQARVVWSAEDVGPSVDGFHDNLVVGHLILDRKTSTSSFRFSAAGDRNAIYVDYLELQDFSFSDYRNGLTIDPNMTIYFAASNFEPQKLMAVFPDRLIWVQGFRGPNSTKAVPRSDGSACLMNLSEATSQIIDSDGDGTPNGFDALPLDNDATGVHVDCPGDTIASSFRRTFFTGSAGKSITSLNMSVTGDGKIAPQPRSGMVELGKTYTFNAVAQPGNLFAGWTGDINTTQPKISFTLLSNMVVNARFVPNPFIANKGSFNGLFYDTNGVTIESAGSVVLTLGQQGGFSGHLTMAAGVVPFGGQFDADGNSTVVVPRGKSSRLTFTLKFDATAKQITGTVQNDTNWTANLVADLAVYGGRNPSPYAGNYTYAWSGNTNDPVNNPGGDTYGTVMMNRAGMLTGVTRFADHLTTTQTVPISKDGNWPFFVAVGGKEMAIGWVHVDTNKVLSGTITWIKKPSITGFYRGGFSQNVSLFGSAWVAPKNHSLGVNLTTSSILTLTGGNLGSALSPALSYNPNNQTFSSTNPSLSLKLIPSLGLFSGQLTDPTTSRIRPINGVLLQNQNSAHGFFLGADQSGAVRLKNP